MSGFADVQRYQFFLQKPQFELENDQYGKFWAAFAVETGSFEYAIGNTKGSAAPGSLVLCPPETMFYRRTRNPISFHFFIFSWVPHNPQEDSFQPPTGKAAIMNTQRVLSSLALLRSSLSETQAFAKAFRSHLLTDLIYIYRSEQQFANGFLDHPDKIMAEARAYMQQSFTESYTLQQLASRYGLSAVQFNRRFKSAFRTNPSDFIRKLRLQKAAGLLIQSELTIDAIAQQSGYANGFYLCRVFQEKYKMSPSAYRRAHRV